MNQPYVLHDAEDINMIKLVENGRAAVLFSRITVRMTARGEAVTSMDKIQPLIPNADSLPSNANTVIIKSKAVDIIYHE
jgi:hypothetical protein